jgi:serine/threonine-protein kinase
MSQEQVQLVEFFNRLSPPERQALADSLAMYKEAESIDVSSFPVRARFGSMMAPTRMVEFTDMLCGHCAALANTVKELKRALPDGLLSIEARQYPLDGECNPQVMRTDGSGTRCMAAKAQICLENAPDFWELREKLFEAQRTLTKDSVLSIASSGSVSKETLLKCIDSEETARKLQDDIRYALSYQIEGTPLVLVNGKQGSPMGAFLYSIAMSRGDASSTVFASLPKPSLAGDFHP